MIALTLKTETIIKARTPRDGLKLQSSFFLSYLNSMELKLFYQLNSLLFDKILTYRPTFDFFYGLLITIM